MMRCNKLKKSSFITAVKVSLGSRTFIPSSSEISRFASFSLPGTPCHGSIQTNGGLSTATVQMPRYGNPSAVTPTPCRCFDEASTIRFAWQRYNTIALEANISLVNGTQDAENPSLMIVPVRKPSLNFTKSATFSGSNSST